MDKNTIISVIGLGYVGLPLAVEFGKQFPTIGFDIDAKRIETLKKGTDTTHELSDEELDEAKLVGFTANIKEIESANVFIIAVPTPVDVYKQPDLVPLLKATEMVGKILKQGDLVIYESTVFPGCTEEECVPILEKESGLKLNEGFFCGYSPERVNPGDKDHRVNNIKKIVSGSSFEATEIVEELYKKIVSAGTHAVSSIRVAEAAKVIENSQRDLNIAFVNELAKLFNLMGIDTSEVLEAAETKWNFMPFKPGLVGGHCIGVDPYYLAHKAARLNYHPEVILAGRRINDGMGKYVAHQVIKCMIQQNIKVKGAEVLVLGITFKENCSDVSNSKVFDIISELKEFGCNVDVFDPVANGESVQNEYGITLILQVGKASLKKYAAVILATAHTQFRDIDFGTIDQNGTVLYDVKNFIPKEFSAKRL